MKDKYDELLRSLFQNSLDGHLGSEAQENAKVPWSVGKVLESISSAFSADKFSQEQVNLKLQHTIFLLILYNQTKLARTSHDEIVDRSAALTGLA